MSVVQISLHIVTFLSLISLKKSTHTFAPCVNIWSVTFLFLFFSCHLLNVRCMHRHITQEGQVEWTTLVQVTGEQIQIILTSPLLFHNVTCYANSIVSHIHVNTTKLHNITHTLVVTDVILRSLKCIFMQPPPQVPTRTTTIFDEVLY